MPNSKISSKKPRETAGRDTILRFDYQFRRTAEASLQLLENGNLERVFCDLHDDYVLKIWENEKALFLFHQVKTKKKDGDQLNGHKSPYFRSKFIKEIYVDLNSKMSRP